MRSPRAVRGRRGETIGRKLLLAGIVLAACALRLAYLLDSHPFFDEYTTILAARTILQKGLPVLPSGLFYDHGLLFSYLDAPFVGLGGWLQGAGGDSLKAFFALARLPSLLVGMAALALLYRVGRRWLSLRVGLVAAALLALSPEGVVWGARARMYGLAQLLVLVLAFLVYEGSRGRGSARLRWLALLTLLAALLTQLGTIILVPPLVIGALSVGWLTRQAGERPWFWRWEMVAEAAALAGTVGVGVLVKRLGQPLGVALLGSPGAEDIGLEWVRTITYQAGLALDGESLVKFLAREFGVPHHLWLAVLVVVGGLAALAVWALGGSLFARAGASPAPTQGGRLPKSHGPFITLYLWIITVLPVVEMVTLLDPWRRNPRYLVMVLPWFYLLAAAGLEHILSLRRQRCFYYAIRNTQYAILGMVFHAGYWLCIIALAVLQARGVWLDLQVAFRTPEPAYEQAFRYVGEKWQPGDVLLTMNTCGAATLLGHVDYFAAQEGVGQFLLYPSSSGESNTQPIDRWLGSPWLGTAADLSHVLDEHPRAWFVVDTIRLPVYYRGDWLAVLKTQMKLAWSGDGALVYRTRSDRPLAKTGDYRNPLPMQPSIQVNARLGEVVRLVGYDDRGTQSPLAPGSVYALTLFWSTTAPLAADYTVFVHLRDVNGATVAQQDAQPLGGDYPTGRWRVDEVVIDPHQITLPPDLPPGEYQVWVGMYRLDTMERLPVAGDTSGENAIRLRSVVR